MSKFKKYSFWVALMSAIILFIESLSGVFGFSFNKTIFENVVLSICGILVVLGIIVNDKPQGNDKKNQENDETDDKSEENKTNEFEDSEKK